MRPIKIISNNTSDLPKEIINRYGIEMVPVKIILGDDTLEDTDYIPCSELYEFANRTNILPKSSAANVNDFIEVFRKYIDEGYDILCTAISSKLSATYQNAVTAAQEVSTDRIYVWDSLSLSAGIGLQLMLAGDWIEQGFAINDIYKKIQTIVPDVQASFFVDTLTYLHMGGRCSRASLIAGSALKIKPKLLLEDGEIVPVTKYRGSWDKVLKKYIKETLKDNDKIDKQRIFICHTCVSYSKTQALKDELQQVYGFKEVYINEASATIATHCGPNTLGLLFIYK
jgi:DegV family protein with EDD domain